MKKIKKEIQYVWQTPYFFPGTKYAQKLIKTEEKFCDKIRENRRKQIRDENHKFKMTDENIAKLLKVSDVSHEKYLELVKKIRSLEKKISIFADDYPDYCINASLVCLVPLANDDEFYCEIVTEYSWKGHPFEQQDFIMNKDCHIPIRGLNDKKVSYPFYCLIDEGRMSLKETSELTEDNFYFDIQIELE